jgi:endonuclease YncB( thermonuclease family)
METSPSFKQAFKIVIKRNIVRLSLLTIFLGVWSVILWLKGGNRYSVSPRAMVKVTLSRVEAPDRLVLSLNNPGEKKDVPARFLSLDSGGLSAPSSAECEAKLTKRLEGRTFWIRSAYLDSAQRTVGRILISNSGSAPEDVGLQLVREGCAFYCKRDETYLSPADRELYLQAENQAKVGRLGVWESPFAKVSEACLAPQ